LLRFPVWKNPFLVVSIVFSMMLHFGIMYIPVFKASRSSARRISFLSDLRNRKYFPSHHSAGKNGRRCCILVRRS
jgi:hypothetical protein